MDENNNILGNENNPSSSKGPAVYGDPKDTPKEPPKSTASEMPPTVALNEDESSVSDTGSTPTTASPKSAFSDIPVQGSSSSSTEDNIPTYSYQMPNSNSHQGSASVFTDQNQNGYPSSGQPSSQNQTAYPTSGQQSVQASSSNQEVFGGSANNNYYTNNDFIPEQEAVSNGFAVASLVMGILSILTCCCGWLSLIFAVLGIIFSCVQKKDAAGKKPNMATVGMILSIIGGVIALISVIYSIFVMVTGTSSSYSDIFNSL